MKLWGLQVTGSGFDQENENNIWMKLITLLCCVKSTQLHRKQIKQDLMENLQVNLVSVMHS